MRVVICPDSFKGSLTADEAAEAMAAGVLRAWPAADCVCLPMADGGEGTAAIVCRAWGGQWRRTRVTSPRGAPVLAGWGWDPMHQRAVVEVASACGLPLTPVAERNPWQMDTQGVGQLLQAVLAQGDTLGVNQGARSIWVGLGGSGTNDAGAGMLHALGARFLDAAGRPLPPTPAGLSSAVAMDGSGLPAELSAIEWQILTDVDAYLTGSRGASRLFGPQKGVARAELDAWDARLAQLAHLMAPSATATPGDGAAGGMGFAFRTVLGGTLTSGSERVGAALGVPEAIASADWVMTGEGRFDATSLQGKVVGTVQRWALAAGKPLWILAGQQAGQQAEQLVEHQAEHLAEQLAMPTHGTVRVASLVPDLMTEVEALAAPAQGLAELAYRLCRTFGR